MGTTDVEEAARDAERWDARYREAADIGAPARVLSDYAHLLPRKGRALDMACGLGANALLLAKHGLETHAWDYSAVAIKALSLNAIRQFADIHAEVRDVVMQPPETESFDVIVVTHFLERELAPALVQALKPGGLLFYQTYLRERPNPEGPRNPKHTLLPNELLHLFADLRVLAYHDEGLVGDTRTGVRNMAQLVAQKAEDRRLMNIDALEQMLAAGQDNPMLRLTLGQALYNDQQAERACEHLARAVELDPNYSAAWKIYGKALTDAGRIKDAIQAYERGIAAAEKRGNVQAAKEMQVFLKRLKRAPQ